MGASESKATRFFDGRVEIKQLAVTDQPATRTEVRARITTAGGELAVLTDSGETVRHLAYLELRPGTARGHHYHKQRNERFYLISGEVVAHFENLSTGEIAECTLRPGDLLLVFPGIAHVFFPVTSGHALEFAAEPFDSTDVYRHTLAGT